ncbi:LEA14-like protein [Dioscorea alata]|uniref:LEA14-like protein n=1 Tax=Dioscorea alata TaxID=55571 RepID=A0ACB7UMR8_DIOAL|nr:LEA14-like protein [Dioscorea alata]
MEKFGASATPFLQPPPPPPPASEPYYGIPAPIYDPSPPTYILLPVFPRRRRRPCRWCGSLLSSSCLLSLAFVSVLLAGSLFFLWPSDPEISVSRLRLNRIHIFPQPIVRLDISIGLEIKVRNRDFFSLDYDSVVASIGYRGRRLGSVISKGGHLVARGVSYVDAELHLDGIRVLNDVFYLIEDLARGSIPLDTVTEIEGQLHLFSLDVPIQGRISCAVHVNPENQTIIHQGCYPE